MPCILAIDAGTTGVRTLAFDESGGAIDLAWRPLPRRFPRPGWVEQDPDEIWGLVRATLAEVGGRQAAAGRAVAAIGITNQRETAVAWDRRTGRPLSPAIVWLDRRTADRCDALAEAGYLDLVRRTTGLVLDPYFSATKFGWLLGEGGVATSADLALGTVDSWLLWQLTGGPGAGTFATDPSNASRTSLFDIGGLAWSAELCDLFGVPLAALPEVRPSCGRLGTVAPDAIGGDLLAGTAVSAMAGDQQAALFGQACTEPGMAKVTYGTGSFVLAHAGSTVPAPADGLLTTVAWDLGDHSPGRRGPAYALEGSAFVAGAALQWLRDGLGLIVRSEDVGPLAGSVTTSAGLHVVPAFSGLGSPWWDPRARGAVLGVAPGVGKAELARAVVESIAFGVRAMVDAMAAATGRRCAQLRADGGASAMGLLLQLQADQLGVPVVRPRCTESSALGAALLAGLAERLWGSVAEAAALWQPDEERRPLVARDVADASYGRWIAAVERARGWAADAPGGPGDDR